MPKKSKVERWREMAERARTRADGKRDDASKRSMLGMAKGYEALARRADLLIARQQSAETDEKPDSCERSCRQSFDRLSLSTRKEERFGMAQSAEEIYRSSNGDSWTLIRDADSGRLSVRHEANPSSGGRVTDTDVDVFLSIAGSGPEFTALRRLLNKPADSGLPSQ
jgi:hypothetical protein